MYAIIDTCGKQYRVQPGDTVTLDRMDAEVGSEITFDKVLLVHGDELVVGSPNVEGAQVKAKVVDHTKGPKVITFKMRRTRRYRRRVGFRHSHTTVEILDIQA